MAVFASAWLVIPPQAWACGGCSEVAVNSSMAVGPSDGGLTLSQTDLALPGYAGLDLTRSYGSQNNTFSMFGYGWTWNLMCNLANTTGDITVNFGTSSQMFVATNGYVNANKTMQLSFVGDVGSSNAEIHVENRFGRKWIFDATTQACKEIVDRNGNRTLFETTVTNKVVASVGGTNQTEFVFLPTKVTYPDGRSLLFSYTDGLCSRVDGPDGRSIDYSYTDGLLTGITENNGQVISYGYTVVQGDYATKGWLTNVTYASGADVNLGYNGEFGTSNTLRVTSVSGPLGYDHAYGYVVGTSNLTTLLADSRGSTTVYANDWSSSARRSIQTTNALGYAELSFENRDTGITQLVDQRGNSSWRVYDRANTNVLAQMNLLQTTNRLGKVWSYAYNDQNLRTRTTSPLGQVSTMGYDTHGNLTVVTNALGQQVASLTYTTNALLASVTDGRGNITSFARDNAGLVTNMVDALTNGWSRSYDDSGNMIRAANPLGNAVTLGYNGFRKVSALTNALGQVTRFAYDEMANLTNVTDAAGNTTATSYDALQRVTKLRDALGNETRFSYDPESNLTTLSNALGHAYSYSYDPVNQVKTFTYPDATKESYVYDANGNLTRLTNRSGQVISAVYDTEDRLTSRTWEGATNVVFNLGWDDASRLTSMTRVKGGVTESAITNSYNAANRLTSQVQSGVAGIYTVGYAHDVSGNVTNVAYPSGLRVSYDLDPLNRIAGIRDSTPGSGPVANYEFDTAGRLTKRKLQNGTECIYSYNVANQVTNITLQVTGKKKQGSRDNDEDRNDNEMDRDGKDKESKHTGILQSLTYGYDQVGNRIWVKYKNGRGDVYQYDATYQVTGVKYNVDDPTVGYVAATNPSRTVTYNYDALGNRTSMTDNGNTTSYSIDNLNQYTWVGTTGMSYDTRGNLTNNGEWTFGYDHENHLVSASKTGMTVTYAYDALGRRIVKNVNGAITRYVYSGSNLIEERNGSGSILAKYVYEGGIDRPVKVIKGASTYYFQQDALGNVTALVDANGRIAEQYSYDIYGQPTIKDGNGNVLSAASTPFLFTGREYDSETGLYHYRARAYSATLGRFLQPDPIDFNGGDANIYRTVANDPINEVDPFGLYYGNFGLTSDIQLGDCPGGSSVPWVGGVAPRNYTYTPGGGGDIMSAYGKGFIEGLINGAGGEINALSLGLVTGAFGSDPSSVGYGQGQIAGGVADVAGAGALGLGGVALAAKIPAYTRLLILTAVVRVATNTGGPLPNLIKLPPIPPSVGRVWPF